MLFFIKVSAILISAVAIVGNALVCHVIVRLKTMKTSINYIILNLAVLDTIFGFVTIFYVIANDYEGSLGQPILQRAYNSSPSLAHALCMFKWTYYSTPSVSPILLTAMAYERYKAIVDPFSRLDTGATSTRIKCIIVLAWLSGLGYLTVDMIIVEYEKETIYCMPKPYPWLKLDAYLFTFLITQYITPSMAMLLFYGRVICALRRQDNALGPQAEAERARRKARKKVMWIVIVVTLVFYICCGFPKILLDLMTLFKLFSVNSTLVWEILVILLSFNSAFNPFLYFIFIQSFRDGFKRVFLSRNRNSNAVPLERGTSSQQSLPIIAMQNNHTSQPQLLSLRFLNSSDEN